MIDTSRRTVLGAGALLAVGSVANGAVSPPATERIEADLNRYVGFGEKRAGGPGDTACGDWLAGE